MPCNDFNLKPRKALTICGAQKSAQIETIPPWYTELGVTVQV